ncbi:protein AroM [Tistlia consotensis]|uniref:Protein AroM n=1 Tax=Tistlia consotensis USBA 355 TaxID=560819 RepID=A0A1Y6CEK1_9PROT|nr:AroM family protein [Tistlia consotensis]SMF59290.1 protein AroM [Tistlia consotensis USBA 355]SNR64315.1 protein AroM [Tistlia consotensis]
MAKRSAFVTIGQAPRVDLTPEILAEVRCPLDVVEVGALDGLSDAEVAALAPGAGEERLVSRLVDGREVILGKTRIQQRLQALFDELDGQGFDLIVLLCTGHFEPFRVKTLFLEPQLAVDHFVQGLAYGAETLGILVPNEKQIDEFHGIDGKQSRVSFASPYGEERFEAAGRELAGTDLVVMHCMGYSEAMRRRVAAASGRPVMLSRRIVAHAVDLLLT